MAKSNAMTPEAFVLRAIPVLAAKNKPYTDKQGKARPPCKGIHSRNSGLNAAVLYQFPNIEAEYREVVQRAATKSHPAQTVTLTGAAALTQRMAKSGLIAVHPCLGGVMVYLPADAPARSDNRGADTAAEILR
jgi:hypothetical protein